LAVFRSFQPYQGGDNLLWSINAIANCQKHRTIHPMLGGVSSVGLRQMKVTGGIVSASFPPAWDGQKNEIVLGEFTAGSKVEYDMDLAIFVAMADIGTVGGTNAIDTLTGMANAVECILLAKEAKARAISLIP
jgi:hypothetical protein